MKKFLIIPVIAVLFAACGGDDGRPDPLTEEWCIDMSDYSEECWELVMQPEPTVPVNE